MAFMQTKLIALLALFWAGIKAGISFLASSLKFSTAALTKAVGLDVPILSPRAGIILANQILPKSKTYALYGLLEIITFSILIFFSFNIVFT